MGPGFPLGHLFSFFLFVLLAKLHSLQRSMKFTGCSNVLHVLNSDTGLISSTLLARARKHLVGKENPFLGKEISWFSESAPREIRFRSRPVAFYQCDGWSLLFITKITDGRENWRELQSQVIFSI